MQSGCWLRGAVVVLLPLPSSLHTLLILNTHNLDSASASVPVHMLLIIELL